MVWASVREDNPQALASSLSSFQTQKFYSTSMQVNFVYCEIFNVIHLNITQRFRTGANRAD